MADRDGMGPVVDMGTIRVEKPWGRCELPPPFRGDGARLRRPIGEIRFQCEGRRLDLMVKYIFTSQKLSIQVHPSDDQARALGHCHSKEECWYILDAEPGAAVGIGTVAAMDPAEMKAACRSGEIEYLMDWIPVNAGDFFYIPAGTVHAIGAGITLIEVQQNTDITYRLYDYGRPRELHLDRGIDACLPHPYPASMRQHVSLEDPAILVDGPHFRLAVSQGWVPALDGTGPLYVVPVQGAVKTRSGLAAAGQCLLVNDPAEITAGPETRLFVARSCGTPERKN